MMNSNSRGNRPSLCLWVATFPRGALPRRQSSRLANGALSGRSLFRATYSPETNHGELTNIHESTRVMNLIIDKFLPACP